jgi:type I restriction enzyme S subunit
MNYTSIMQTKTNKRPLPKGWKWSKLSEVCNIIMGQSPPGNTYRKTPDGLPFFQGKADFGLRHPIARVWCIEPTRIAEQGDILLSVRAPVGPTNVADIECCIGRGLAAIQPKEQADKEFILLALKYREDILAGLGSGSTFEAIRKEDLFNLEIPIPPLDEQRRIASWLNEKLAAVESARKAAEEQLQLTSNLIKSYLIESLSGSLHRLQLKDGFIEVKQGIGKTWYQYPVLGTTRNGVAPAKEKVGKQPERYKLVGPGTIFYNPMRINIGSIGMLDEGDAPGITSPDYVVMNAVKDVIHSRWFYYWLRSPYGEEFIKTYARGAVRERMMFTRLAPAYLEVPTYEVQSEVAEKLFYMKQLRAKIESQLAEINRLPASLLREAFVGEI